MAKKKIEATPGNIENLSALEKEYKTGKMISRKAIVLKQRLKELWDAGKITEAELDLFRYIMKRELLKGTISDLYLQVINKIESEECELSCVAKDIPSESVMYITKGDTYKYFVEDEQDPDRLEKGIQFKYTIFVKRYIKPEFQLTRELVLKEDRGHHINENEWPKEKVLLHRLTLNEKWFEKYFDTDKDILTTESEKEEVYNF